MAIARRHGLLIIEDAAYAFLAEDAPAPLAALAPESTVYVSGLSKSVATGLRVGFVAAPSDRVPALERAIRATTWNTPGVMTAIACGWIDDGTVTRLEAQKRQDATARQAIAAEVLAGLRSVRHPASYFVWLPLAEERRADQLAVALMRERDLGVDGRALRDLVAGAACPPTGAGVGRPRRLAQRLGDGAPRDRRAALVTSPPPPPAPATTGHFVRCSATLSGVTAPGLVAELRHHVVRQRGDGVVGVVEGDQQGARGGGQMVEERDLGVEQQAQREGGDEHADHPVVLGARAARHRRADHQVALAGQAEQQGLVGRQQHRVRRGAGRAGQGPQAAGPLLANLGAHRAPSKSRTAGRAKSAGRSSTGGSRSKRARQ